MTNKAVIFDLDNTLVNRKSAFRNFASLFIDNFVNFADPLEKERIIKVIQVADRDGYRKKRDLYEELKNNLNMKDPKITVETLLNFWNEEFNRCTVLMEGGIELLDYLKKQNYSLGLITNGSIHSQNSKIDFVGIRKYFDVIVVSDEVGVKKPDKRIFEIALSSLNVNSNDSWYVGDHPINDIKGAREAGLNTIWLEGFMEWDRTIVSPNHFVKNLTELTHIF